MKTIKSYHRDAVRRSVRYWKNRLPYFEHRYVRESVWTRYGVQTEESSMIIRNRAMRPLIHKGRKA